EVQVWDIQAGTDSVFSPPTPLPKGETGGGISALALSPNDRHLALVDDYRTVRLVDRKNGSVVAVWPRVMDTIEALRLDPDGRTLYAAGRHAPDANAGRVGIVIGWDLETKNERIRWEGPALGMLSRRTSTRYYSLCDLSGDGRLAAFVENVAKDGKGP